jgi:MFS family permease
VLGTNIAFIGIWMLRIAQGWLTLRMTGSGTALGLVGTCTYVPIPLVGSFAGVLADRYPKRRIISTTSICMGLAAMTLGLLDVTGHVRLWQLYALVTLYGIASAVDMPTRMSFVIEMVGKESLANAVALDSASINTARLIGPAIAGVLITAIGTGWVITAYACSTAAVIFCLSRIRTADLQPAELVARTSGQFRSGLRYVRGHPSLRRVFVSLLFVGTFGMTQDTILPLAASHVFHRSAGVYGLFAAAMASGTLVGALVAAHRARASSRVFTGSCLGFGMSWIVVSQLPTQVAFVLALPVLGLFHMSVVTAANAIVQVEVAPAFRGRVMALYLTALLGGLPVGAPLIGWLAQAAGTRIAALAAGLLTLAGAFGGLYVAGRGTPTR